MKLALVALMLLAAGCAYAAPVTLVWTYPRFNALPGTCITPADTLHDLARCELYARRAGRPDSLLVLSKPCAGLENRADSTVVDQPKGGTDYWIYIFDGQGSPSCKSAVVTKFVIGKPLPAVLR